MSSKKQGNNGKQYNNEEQLKGFNSFTPNSKQKHVNNLLIEFPLVFVQGCAGTGKTTGIIHHYCSEYMRDRSKKIMVIRTPVEAGPDKIGYLPGDEDDKLAPHFSTYAGIMKTFMGNKFEADLNKRIHFMVPNYALGATWDDALILIDEAQQLTPAIMKLLLERIGINSVCAVVGDPSQLYADDKTSRNGLTHAMDKFFIKHEYHGRTEYEPKSNMVSAFAYDPEDNVRSDISREVVRVYGS